MRLKTLLLMVSLFFTTTASSVALCCDTGCDGGIVQTGTTDPYFEFSLLPGEGVKPTELVSFLHCDEFCTAWAFSYAGRVDNSVEYHAWDVYDVEVYSVLQFLDIFHGDLAPWTWVRSSKERYREWNNVIHEEGNQACQMDNGCLWGVSSWPTWPPRFSDDVYLIGADEVGIRGAPLTGEFCIAVSGLPGEGVTPTSATQTCWRHLFVESVWQDW